MKSLDQIAIEKGTDKSSKGHSYTQYYEFVFDHIRFRPLNVLEIGIDSGASVRMWRDFFPHSEVHGIDLREGYDYLHDLGIHTHVVDHSNPIQLISFGLQYDKYFDIIVEDGSHQSEDSVMTFELLFEYLKPGGFYCIEDMLCDYDPRWNKGRSTLERVKKMISEVNMSGNISHDNLCSNKSEQVKKYSGSYFDLNIEYVFQSCGLCIIKKLPDATYAS